jgi:hypothetical protein
MPVFLLFTDPMRLTGSVELIPPTQGVAHMAQFAMCAERIADIAKARYLRHPNLTKVDLQPLQVQLGEDFSCSPQFGIFGSIFQIKT